MTQFKTQDSQLPPIRPYGKKFTILDTETTGLSFASEIIEIAYIQCDAEDTGFKVRNTFQTLVRPRQQVQQFITNINGITNEMLTGAPSWDDVWPRIATDLHGTILVGQYIDFDLRMMGQMHGHLFTGGYDFQPGRPIDTREMINKMRLHEWVEDNLPDFNKDRPAHQAENDVIACWHILSRLWEVWKDDPLITKAVPCATRFGDLSRAWCPAER